MPPTGLRRPSEPPLGSKTPFEYPLVQLGQPPELPARAGVLIW